MTIQEKFDKLGIDNAPGQEALQKSQALELRCEKLEGAPVDFSHGDVDAHIPTPGSFEVFSAGVEDGGRGTGTGNYAGTVSHDTGGGGGEIA